MSKTIDELERKVDGAASAYGLASYREGKLVGQGKFGTPKHASAIEQTDEAIERFDKAVALLLSAVQAGATS